MIGDVHAVQHGVASRALEAALMVDIAIVRGAFGMVDLERATIESAMKKVSSQPY